MAGAVPQQRGGSNATTIGMVVSILVAVLLLGGLIWLITQQEQLRTNAEQATAAKKRLATGGDEAKAKQMFPDAGGVNKTLVGEMNKGIALVCRGMTGNENDSPTAARGKLDAALAKISASGKVADPEKISSDFGAVAIIDYLHQLYADEKTAREKAEADLARASGDLDAARAANEDLTKKISADLAKMRTKVEELQAAKSEFENLKSGETQALASQIGAKQDAIDAMRREQVDMRRKLANELGHRDRLLDEQREAISTLRGPGPATAQELAIARNGVGRVLRALPGDSLVHIDLGKEDNVTLGLTFSVYSEDERVPADGRGKANIEVVSVGRRTAECRVTARPSPDDPILEGDIVGNIVLSRDHDKKQRFCIVGQFDIDFDGNVDAMGNEAIAALVRRFGGEVVDRVDPTTDYVVVGQEPPLIGVAEPEEIAPAEEAEPEAPAEAEPEKAGDEGEAAAEEGDSAAEESTEEEPSDEESAEETPAEGEGESAEGEEADEPAADEATSEEPAAEEETAEGGDEEAAEGGEDEAKPEEDAAEDTDEAEEKPAATEEEAPAEEPAATEEAKPADTAVKSAAVPTIPRAPEIDTTQGPRTRRAMNERQRFDEAIMRARMFSIPRLPQDRFFNFVGLEPDDAVKQLEG
ncbi:MAG TPA: hypothetical protein VJZ71_01310 [Phycisphaerae bacterium]|nr:hypothetical protein [Phycisphaerae bacterium]